MWVPNEFRKAVYSEKALDPSKTLTDIIRDMTKRYEEQKQKDKKSDLWPKF